MSTLRFCRGLAWPIRIAIGVAVTAACENDPATSTDGLMASIDPCADARALELLTTTRFMRSSGAPRIERRTIDVPFDGRICVRIENGGDPRVRSASVQLDGRSLATAQALRSDAIAIPLDVESGEHLLEVELRSTPGAAIDVGVRGLPGPGIPFESLPDGDGGLAVAAGGVVSIGFTVFDVLHEPVPDATVELEAAAMPFESPGLALRDPATDAAVFVGVAPSGPSLSLTADAAGHAELEAQPRGLGVYRLDVHVVGQSWLPQSALYLEATPSPGSWRDYAGDLIAAPETRLDGGGRENASLMFDVARRQVLLFGGERHTRPPDESVPPTPREALVDVWALPLAPDPTIAPTAWQRLTVVGPDAPRPVLGANAVYVPPISSIVAVTSAGGTTDNLAVWRFAQDGASGTWSRLPVEVGPDNELPVPIRARRYGSAVYDPVHQRVVLFGGIASDGILPVDPEGVTGPFGGPVRSDVIFIDVSDPTRAVVRGRTAPAALAPRRQAMLLFDETRNRVVMWGGADGGSAPEFYPETMLGDAWELSFVADPLSVWAARSGSSVSRCPDASLGAG